MATIREDEAQLDTNGPPRRKPAASARESESPSPKRQRGKTGEIHHEGTKSVKIKASELASVSPETAAAAGPASSATRRDSRGSGKDSSGQTLSRIRLDRCERHPANRRPSEAAIAKVAQSIVEFGLLEPPTVRPLPGGKWQIISGETRLLALASLGRSGEIDARVIACTDREALVLVAEHNGQREDLSPIDKARLIERLGQPEHLGGAAMTRERAARHVGLASASAASNLVRLLRLPEIWQQRVAKGELEESFARLLVPVAHIEPVLAEAERAWKGRDKRLCFDSRDDLERAVWHWFDCVTRPLTAGVAWSGHIGDRYWRGECAIHADDLAGNAKKLGLVKMPREWLAENERRGKNLPEELEFATNAKLWEKLQAAAIAAAEKKKASKAGGKADSAAAKAKAKPRTAAEEKAIAERNERHRAERIAAWRHDWLRSVVAERISASGVGDPARHALAQLMLYLARAPIANWELAKRGVLGKERGADDWQIAHAADGPDAVEEQAKDLVCRLLTAEDRDPRRPLVEHRIVLDLAEQLKLDLADEWERLAIVEGGPERLENFLLLHDSAGLAALAQEWNIPSEEIPAPGTRSQLVGLLHERLTVGDAAALPQCLAFPGKRKLRKERRSEEQITPNRPG